MTTTTLASRCRDVIDRLDDYDAAALRDNREGCLAEAVGASDGVASGRVYTDDARRAVVTTLAHLTREERAALADSIDDSAAAAFAQLILRGEWCAADVILNSAAVDVYRDAIDAAVNRRLGHDDDY